MAQAGPGVEGGDGGSFILKSAVGVMPPGGRKRVGAWGSLHGGGQAWGCSSCHLLSVRPGQGTQGPSSVSSSARWRQRALSELSDIRGLWVLGSHPTFWEHPLGSDSPCPVAEAAHTTGPMLLPWSPQSVPSSHHFPLTLTPIPLRPAASPMPNPGWR